MYPSGSDFSEMRARLRIARYFCELPKIAGGKIFFTGNWFFGFLLNQIARGVCAVP
jgi:hypothetical protein